MQISIKPSQTGGSPPLAAQAILDEEGHENPHSCQDKGGSDHTVSLVEVIFYMGSFPLPGLVIGGNPLLLPNMGLQGTLACPGVLLGTMSPTITASWAVRRRR